MTQTLDGVERHLFTYGISSVYNKWVYHGEATNLARFERGATSSEGDTLSREANVGDEDDDILDLLNDLQGSMIAREEDFDDGDGFDDEFPEDVDEMDTSNIFEELMKEARNPLYHGCTKFSSLNFLVKLMHIKVLNNWSNKSFDMLLKLLKDAFPVVCGESRYKTNSGKGKKIPNKMRWHKDKRVDTEDVLRHPADAAGWKHFDKEFPQFASEPRNVRLGLASDGFNPFGNMSTAYSMWPVVLIPYNLPPWKCMKESNFFMSLLVPGPKSPGKELDVYLQPLIDELKELWNNGVRTFDCTDEEYFRLHACLLWTINDFPAYGDLSGWSTKGYQACPTCKEDTLSFGIKGKYLLWDTDVIFLLIIFGVEVDIMTTIRVSDLNRLEADIVLILCKLERIFPPAFFDIMIHLAVHLPAETKIVDPVSYSWMYPIERSLRTLKQYVRNKARPEGSIAEAFIMNECLTFCSMYLIGIETRFNRNPRNDDSMNRQLGCGDFDVFKQNVRPMGGMYSLRERGEASDDLYSIALGPINEVRTYSGCFKKRETNKRSRSAVKFNHVTGAKSFLQVRHELKKKKGCDVDEIEVFHETHFREKEGWINDKAKDAYLEMQRIITESTEAGVQTISTAKACEFVLGSRSMQTVNPRSGESLRSNVSSTREKEKNEMAYLKEANEKLTHELAKWEQSYGN
ncbi:uncharacterized protein E6C27_scaffold403G00370 [Cucumis melo var. makuwa]|uniref:DUF4218 domain-containing protein n=1 Tax=Cucumis melo var. makuwa TaxID=1194695 RepID=A0A5A7SWX9_CUCMM|nr:uncharacterized protein E6C27_scaffold403G00370 [Cucumis melo var. makuwa]